MRTTLDAPATDTASVVIASPSPSLAANHAQGAGVTAATLAGKEPCSCCGSSAWTSAHFTNGSLVCADCCAEIRRTQESPPMPPTASQRRQLDLWCRPQRGVRP